MKYSKWQDCLCSIPTSRFKFTMQYVFYIFRCLIHRACIHPSIHTSIHPYIHPSFHPSILTNSFMLCMFIFLLYIYIPYIFISIQTDTIWCTHFSPIMNRNERQVQYHQLDSPVLLNVDGWNPTSWGWCSIHPIRCRISPMKSHGIPYL